MPYIEQTRRDEIDAGDAPKTVGELTYVLYKASVDYLRARDESYAVHAVVKGALDNAKDEFYRRHTAPYEDQKIIENGDVS